MAAAGIWDYRSPSYEDKALLDPLIRIIESRVVKRLSVHQQELLQESPDGKAEIQVNFTNIFDGTGTPAVVDIISTSIQDDTGGTGALTYGLFGTDENDAYVQETVTANGQSAATSTTLWKRLIGLKVLTAGTGLKAAGVVTVHENGGVINTYMTIAANGLSTISSRFWLANGWRGVRAKLVVNSIFTQAAGAVTLDSGSNLYPTFVDALLTREVIHKYTIVPAANVFDIPVHWEVKDGSDDSYFSIQHETLDTTKNRDLHLDIFYLFWQEHS